MKKLLLLLIVSFWTTLAAAQTQTPNLKLKLPLAAPGTWGQDYNDNFTTLDSAVGSSSATMTRVTFANLPGTPTTDQVVTLTDGAAAGSCAAGGGVNQVICQWNGSAWVAIGSAVDTTGNFTWSGTHAFTIAPTAAGQDICLEDGTNCPSAGAESDPVLNALKGMVSANGSVATARTITGTTGNVVVSNGDGLTANPTIDLGTTAVQTDQSNTFTAGDQSYASATSFTFPTATGAAPTTSGRCAYDSTANRLKCGFNGTTVILATTTETQPLHANLTSFSTLSGASGAIPYFSGASSMAVSQLALCTDSGGQHLNITSISPLTFSCGTSSTGGLSGMTGGKLQKALTASTIGDSLLSESGSNVTVGGGLIVGTTPFLIFDTSGIAASDKTWTIMNFSGTIRPSTGALTPGNVITVDANGLLVDGGAAGAGTWTDSSTSTGTNKTIDVEGTGNVITTVSKIWLPAAGGTAAAPGLLWDTLATNAPTAVCSAGTTETTLLRCYADFPDSDGDYSLQQAIALPSDWTGAVDLKFKYSTVTANAGLNTIWQAATVCRADGEVDDATFNAASATAADAGKGTTLQLNDATITGLTTTGCAAGELMHLKIFRNRTHASDTMTGVLHLHGVEVTLRRAQ